MLQPLSPAAPLSLAATAEVARAPGSPAGRFAVPLRLRWPLAGLGGEGNVCIPVRRGRIGSLRVRVWSSRRARAVEATWQQWNKVLRPSLHLVVIHSGVGDRLVRFVLVEFEAPDLDEPCQA